MSVRSLRLAKQGPLPLGQRWLVEREWLSDGRVMQRTNDGRPDVEDEWKQLGRWSDLDAERAKIAREGWELD